MPNKPFVILVVDRDPAVEVVSARLLSSALETEHTTFPARVCVLATENEIAAVNEPELPPSVAAISQRANSANQTDIDSAKIIVGFSGLDEAKIDRLRNAGVAAPAVNLCQFVLNLEVVAANANNFASVDARDVIIGAAMQVGIEGGSSKCEICADKVGDSIDYWINIADTCSRFAQTARKFQT